MKKRLKIILFIVLGIVLLFNYFALIDTPLYPGHLTLSINNNTFSAISGATLLYEVPNITLELPDIKPFERVIIIPPYDICGKPLKTRIFLNHDGKSGQIVGEFYSIYGDRSNSDVRQTGWATIHKNKIDDCSTDYKPYFRIIDMNTIKIAK